MIDRLLAWRTNPRLARHATRVLQVYYGIDLPVEVQVGRGLVMPHMGRGAVIHPCTTIGDYVTIYHGVTIGRSDAHIPAEDSAFEHIEIGDHVVLSTGSVVLGGPGITTVGTGTILAANAVLRQSTGDWEVWAGIPARKVGSRTDRGAAQG